MKRDTTSSKLNDFINTHKYAITMTAISVTCMIMLRRKNSMVEFVKAKTIDDPIYGYAKFD